MAGNHGTNGQVFSLQKVMEEEWKQALEGRRKTVNATDFGSDGTPLEHNLVGLALSGGGIRSAMFNMGVLQAFYKTGLLRFIDYMVTVSGGGFIGGFVTARIHTEHETSRRNGSARPAHES